MSIRLRTLSWCVFAAMPSAQAPPAFEVQEATIAKIHAAMLAGLGAVKSLTEIVTSGRVHPTVRRQLDQAMRHRRPPDSTPPLR